MDNAIKYTNSGGKITVNLNVDKTKTKLIVKNTGEGIAKEHLEKYLKGFIGLMLQGIEVRGLWIRTIYS